MNHDVYILPKHLPPWDIENVLRAKRALFVRVKWDEELRVVFSNVYSIPRRAAYPKYPF